MLLMLRGRGPAALLLLAIAFGTIDPVAAQTDPIHQPDPPGLRSSHPESTDGSTLPAGAGKKGHGTAAIRVGYYDSDDSGDGNPFLDESLTVIEPIFLFSYNVTDHSSVWGTLSYDRVSSASIDRLSNFPTQSGASGDDYFGLDLGWRTEIDDDTRFGIFGHYSFEYDYQSIGLGGDLAVDVAGKNATIKANVSGFFDSIDVIRFNGVEEGSETRTSLASTLSWYQIFSPKTHGSLGITLGHQDGFLETPYNSVVVEDSNTLIPHLENARGTEIAEELPDTRTRVAVFGQARTSLTDRTAVELGARIYSDTWGISSVSLEPRIYYWLVPDEWRLRARYRAYMQTEADDYDEHFLTTTQERTQDSDLGAFNSHTLGLQLLWSPSTSTTFDISGDYILRSDGLDEILASVGWSWAF